MELKKQITILEVETKIKELRKIEEVLIEQLKVIYVDDLHQFKNIDGDISEEIIKLGKKYLEDKKNKILTELQEYGIVKYKTKPLEE